MPVSEIFPPLVEVRKSKKSTAQSSMRLNSNLKEKNLEKGRTTRLGGKAKTKVGTTFLEPPAKSQGTEGDHQTSGLQRLNSRLWEGSRFTLQGEESLQGLC